jgi:hypothetical protein
MNGFLGAPLNQRRRAVYTQRTDFREEAPDESASDCEALAPMKRAFTASLFSLILPLVPAAVAARPEHPSS